MPLSSLRFLVILKYTLISAMITHIDLEIHSPETLWSWSFTHMFNRITHFKPSPGIAISTGIRLGSLWHRRPSKFGKLLLIRTVCELWSINAFTMEGKQFSGPSTVQDHHKWGTVKGAVSSDDAVSMLIHNYWSMCVFCRFWWFMMFIQSSTALYDLDSILGYLSGLWTFNRSNFNHFWASPTFSMFLFNFRSFACLYLSYRYPDRLLMHLTYYRTPINVFMTFSDLFLSLFIFTVFNIPMFWLLLIALFSIGSTLMPMDLLAIFNHSYATFTSLKLFLLIF